MAQRGCSRVTVLDYSLQAWPRSVKLKPFFGQIDLSYCRFHCPDYSDVNTGSLGGLWFCLGFFGGLWGFLWFCSFLGSGWFFCGVFCLFYVWGFCLFWCSGFCVGRSCWSVFRKSSLLSCSFLWHAQLQVNIYDMEFQVNYKKN